MLYDLQIRYLMTYPAQSLFLLYDLQIGYLISNPVQSVVFFYYRGARGASLVPVVFIVYTLDKSQSVCFLQTDRLG